MVNLLLHFKGLAIDPLSSEVHTLNKILIYPQGHALETERCGVALGWDCPFYQDSGGTDIPAERPEVKAEVGPGCRCGCVVHLGVARPRRLVASSSQSCPGRTFWLIQVPKIHTLWVNVLFDSTISSLMSA